MVLRLDWDKVGWYNAAQKIAQLHEQGRTHGMKDHPERTARLHLLEYMFAGHSWQTAVSQSGLHIARSTAYRLRQRARDEDKAAGVFLDDRHGRPYKLTESVRAWLVEFCTNTP